MKLERRASLPVNREKTPGVRAQWVAASSLPYPGTIAPARASSRARWMALSRTGFEPCAARPAQVERRRILLAAFRAGDGRAVGRRAQVLVDQVAGARGVGGIVDPYLGKRRLDRQLAREARGVRVEDPSANASIRQQIREEVRLRLVRRGIDPFQNRNDSIPVTPSSEIEERPETL